MALESVPYGTGLNTANPPNTDQRKQGDDHLRLIKTAVKQSLELMGGGMTTNGTSTAYTVTTGHVNSPTYQDGHLYAFTLHTANGAAATINYDSIGARTIKKQVDNVGWVNLAANDYIGGATILAYYEASDLTMRIIAPPPAAVAGAFLPLAGGTLTGNVTIAKADPAISLNAAASGQNAIIYTLTAGNQRWVFGKGGEAETGGNAGSTFFINRYNDAGAYLASPVIINRASGLVGINEGLAVAGSLTPTGGLDFIGGLTDHWISNSGGNSLHNFDATDYIAYIRASNYFTFAIGGVQKVAITSAVLDTAAITINAGNIALQAGAALIAPNGTGIVAPNDLVGLRVYTAATLPSAAANPWRLAFASDNVTGSKLVYSDGATWFVSGPGAGGGSGDPPATAGP